MMQINDLLNMEWDEAIDWLIDNQDGYELVASEEAAKLEEKVDSLEKGLRDLIEIAGQCDGWESFPTHAIDAATEVLNKYG
jgi:hypothetical protein